MIFNIIWVLLGLITVWVLWNTLKRNYYESTEEDILDNKKSAEYVYFFCLTSPILIVLGGYGMLMLIFTILITGKKPCIWYAKKNIK